MSDKRRLLLHQMMMVHAGSRPCASSGCSGATHTQHTCYSHIEHTGIRSMHGHGRGCSKTSGKTLNPLS